ncbi:DUF4350 domain-containing protein [Salinibaculum marinum]
MGESFADETSVIQNTESYESDTATGTIGFVISPAEPYSTTDVATIRQFIQRGGTLVVAGDFDGSTNQLLRGLGTSTRITNVPVRDEQEYYRSPALPIAPNVTSSNYTNNISQLTLNYPSSLQLAGNESTVLVRTSSYAYLDLNRDGELNSTETLRQHPVVSREQIGEGELLAVSDPSIFINTMLDQPDNREFVQNLVDRHNRSVLDVSHSGGVPPLVGLLMLLRESTVAQLLGGGLLLAMVGKWRGLLGYTRRLGRRISLSAEVPERRAVDSGALKESLQAKYPDWDEQRVERVAQSIMPRNGEGRNDE